MVATRRFLKTIAMYSTFLILFDATTLSIYATLAISVASASMYLLRAIDVTSGSQGCKQWAKYQTELRCSNIGNIFFESRDILKFKNFC
jgi:hypothetical protein